MGEQRTLSLICADCGGPLTLTRREAVAIYEAGVELCETCLQHVVKCDGQDEVILAAVRLFGGPARKDG